MAQANEVELERFVAEENIARYLSQLHSSRDRKKQLRLSELVREEIRHLDEIGVSNQSERLAGCVD